MAKAATAETATTAETVSAVFADNDPGTVDSDEWTPTEEDTQLDGFEALKAMVKAELMAELRGELAQERALAESKPSKTMIAKIHDGFITDSNGTGKPLRHFRCDSAISCKVQVFDMERLAKYESGELEVPRHEKTGRPLPILDLCKIPGEHLHWLEGHCYTFNENQNRNVERLKRLAAESKQGGMPGIYEDFGGSQWQCHTCPRHPVFLDERTYQSHMKEVHGVIFALTAAQAA
jgi:hypothetical protein